MTKKILVVENAPSSPIGLVAEVFKEQGAAFDLIKPSEGAALPQSPNGYDGLVLLGGPQNALADDTHPYLPELANLTRAFGDADKAVAGICLGAQIIARAYGAENILGRDLEFGYHEVYPLEGAKSDPVLSVIEKPTPIFHWHVDTFTLPAGATHLAKSTMTPNQAIKIGRAVYAFQFHFELTPSTLERWKEAAKNKYGEDHPSWKNTFLNGNNNHGEIAERTGRALTRAWLTQAI